MKNKYKICPECGYGNMTMQKEGNILYFYKNGKFLGKEYDFPDTIYECMDCGWKRD